MKLLYASLILHQAFQKHPYAKLTHLRRVKDGAWSGIIKDLTEDQEYVIQVHAVRSEKFCAPQSVDELLGLEEDIDSQECLKRFNEGFKRWHKFCDLMDKYPDASYAELLSKLEENL